MKQSFEQLESQFPSVFQSWHIIREIGRGSFGEVYEVQRESIGFTETAAIKHISYPRDQYDLQRICSDLGTSDEAAVRDDVYQTVQEFRREYELMRKFSGQSHIVSCEDFQAIQKKDMPGYDIFIRMEILTSISDQMMAGRMDNVEAVRLGINICDALELLESEGIIHRDIKPENLFVNEYGDYKLGDFGAARTLPGADATMSVKGTPAYMAPETALQKPAGPWTDIYSLGLVIYRLLNNNQLPFVEATQSVSTVIREQASSRRISGEKLPAPANAGPELAEVILKACAFEPKDRYQTAAEFKKALIRACPESGKTSRVNGEYRREFSLRNQKQNSIRTSVLTAEEREELERQEKAKREAEEARKQEETLRREAEKKQKKKKIIIIAAICLAFGTVICIAAVLMKQNADNKALYQQAEQMLHEEQFEEAEKAFTELGGFSDAADRVKDVRNAAKLKEGKDLLAAGENLLGAEKIFKDLGDMPEAADLLEKTKKLITAENLLKDAEKQVQKAKEQYAKGSTESRKAASNAYASAKQAYSRLAETDPSAAEMVTECENWILYIEAENDLAGKQYGDAGYKFSELAEAGFMDAGDRAAQVEREKKLDTADKLFAEKKYEEAMAAYSEVLDDPRGISGLQKALSYWNYQNALQMLEDRDYENAAKAFEALGDFSNSGKYMTYALAQQALNEKRYEDALKGFAGLKQFQDAEDMAKEAQKWVNAKRTYEEAGVLYANAKYKDAKEKYDSILFYENAESLSEDCDRYLQLDKARDYMRGNRFSSAYDILKNLEMDGLDDLIADCQFGMFWTDVNSEAGVLLRSCYRYIYDQPQITANGKKNWAKQITPSSRELTGAEIATKFASAAQFLSMSMTNEQRVKALYDALLNRSGREEDDYTREHGVYQDAQICADYLNTGMTVTAVLDRIVKTNEFRKLCRDDGIPTGEITITESRDRDYGITAFVMDCYKICLRRTADPVGLNEYTAACLDRQVTLEQSMIYLATSTEAESYYPDDRDFIRMLYRLMLGREASDEEVEIHMGGLARHGSRIELAESISESAECANYLDKYLQNDRQRNEIRSVNGRYNQAKSNMTSGDYEKARELFLSIPDYRDSKDKAEQCRVQIFCRNMANGEKLDSRVHRCLETIAQYPDLDDASREAFAAGIRRSGSTAEIIRSYTNHPVFASGMITDAERVSAVWYILLNSRPDPKNGEYKQYVSSLGAGMSIGYEIFNLTKTDEYKQICTEEGYDSLEITSGEARDMSYPVTNLVSSSYRQVLGRNGSADEYNSWCVKCLSGEISVRDLMVWFLYCPEAENAIPDKAEFIRTAFRYLLGREATREETDARMGDERKAIALELTAREEYTAHIESMGLK